MISTPDTIPSEPTISVYFDKVGNAGLDPKTSVAKASTKGEYRSYHLKVSTQSSDRGAPVDPRGLYFTDEGLASETLYEWKQVSEAIFNDYIKCLTTKSAPIYRAICRKVINGA